MPDRTIIDCAAAQLVLKELLLNELLSHLPSLESIGGSFIKRKKMMLVLQKAFVCPCTKIEALLVNAEMGKETAQGFGIVEKMWETFCDGLPAPSRKEWQENAYTWQIMQLLYPKLHLFR